MENLARLFDAPVDSCEHAGLAESAWMGGTPVSVRYYLGRLLGRNLFREADADVEQRLVEYISRLTSEAGGALVRGAVGWGIAADIVRFHLEMQTKGTSALKARNIAAVKAFLAKPSASLAELASDLGTTEKQLAAYLYLATLADRPATNRRSAELSNRAARTPLPHSSLSWQAKRLSVTHSIPA